MKEISIYSTKTCKNCKMLKQLLGKENLQYKEIDMSTPVGLTELRMNGVFTMSAPVLQINNKFFTIKELCDQEINIDQYKVEDIIRKEMN